MESSPPPTLEQLLEQVAVLCRVDCLRGKDDGLPVYIHQMPQKFMERSGWTEGHSHQWVPYSTEAPHIYTCSLSHHTRRFPGCPYYCCVCDEWICTPRRFTNPGVKKRANHALCHIAGPMYSAQRRYDAGKHCGKWRYGYEGMRKQPRPQSIREMRGFAKHLDKFGDRKHPIVVS